MDFKPVTNRIVEKDNFTEVSVRDMLMQHMTLNAPQVLAKHGCISTMFG